jgi:diacylglycerol kinase (CTP)
VILHPTRNELHLPRRIFHMATGSIIVAVASLIDSKRNIVLVLSTVTAVAFVIEISRLSSPRLNSWLMRYFGFLIRAGEETQFTGAFHYCVGCALAAVVFPRALALLSILYLAFGDPIASLIGVKYGRVIWRTNPFDVQKSLEGSVACFVFCTFLTFGLSHFFSITAALQFQDRILFSALGGLGAMFGEILPLRTDDNLAMPLISGAFLWLTSSVLNLIPGLYLS